MKATVISKDAFFKSIFIIVVLIFVSWSLTIMPTSLKSSKSKIQSSALTVRTVEEGNVKRTEYLDDDGNITYASDKHFAVRVSTMGENKRLDEFFDEEGNPARQIMGHYALLKEYNAAGKVWRQTYLGTDGEPVLNRSGYAVLHMYYYEEGPFAGKIEKDFYFDVHENPIKLSLGQYGVRKEYDEKGRNSVLTYLGADGQAILTNRGYAKVVRTFDENNKIRTEMYYDLDGNPVSLAKGQYGILKEDGVTTFLDEEGNEFFVLSSYLNTYPFSVILLGSVVVLISMLSNKKMNQVLLILYLGFIIYMTMMYRESGAAKAKLELFWSYRQFVASRSIRREILNNVWLFIPLGAIICRLRPKAQFLIWSIVLSVGIETVQYVSGLGLAELDDIISNALGAVIGWGTVCGIKQCNL